MLQRLVKQKKAFVVCVPNVQNLLSLDENEMELIKQIGYDFQEVLYVHNNTEWKTIVDFRNYIQNHFSENF